MKKILITGAYSGIMRELIKKIKSKYFIYVTVHTENELKNIKEYYKMEKNIECLKLDIKNDLDIEKINKLDIDIFISNAAVGYGGSIINMDINKIKENYEVNVFRNFYLIQ